MNLFGRNDDNEPRGQQFNNQPPRNGPPQRSTSGPSSYGPAGSTGGFYGRTKLVGEVQVLTAQQQYSGHIIALLPVGLAVIWQ